MHPCRIVGLEIPCHAASQESPTPLLRRDPRSPIQPPCSNSHWTPESCLQNPKNQVETLRRTLQSDEPFF